MEVDSLSSRLRNIKQSFKTTYNHRLKERLADENKYISERIYQIYKIANLINKRSKEKISFTALLVEKSKRTIDEGKKVGGLFFL